MSPVGVILERLVLDLVGSVGIVQHVEREAYGLVLAGLGLIAGEFHHADHGAQLTRIQDREFKAANSGTEISREFYYVYAACLPAFASARVREAPGGHAAVRARPSCRNSESPQDRLASIAAPVCLAGRRV